MDVLTVALACSLYPDAALVEKLVRDASRGNVYFVGDTVKLDTYDQATSVAEAKKIIAYVSAAGGRPVVGLMGIPLSWADRFGRPADDLFDACSNVSIGTAMLARFESQCRAALAPAKLRARGRRPALPRELLRPCVLGHFGRELGIANFVAGIMRDLPGSGARRPRPAGGAPAAASSASSDSAVLLLDGAAGAAAAGRSLFFEDPSRAAAPTTPAGETAPILR